MSSSRFARIGSHKLSNARTRLASLRATATWDASSLAHLGTAVGYQPARLGAQFLRVSRADLVNTAHVVRITGNGDGSATLEVTGGAAIHVSRRRAGDVRRALER